MKPLPTKSEIVSEKRKSSEIEIFRIEESEKSEDSEVKKEVVVEIKSDKIQEEEKSDVKTSPVKR